MGHVHKRFTDDQVRDMLNRYLKREIEGPYIRTMLGLSKTHFFRLLPRDQADPATFSIQYTRRTPTRCLDAQSARNILNELTIDKQAIQNPQVPWHSSHYSDVQQRLQTHDHHSAA